MTDYSLWEVIKNGNKVLKKTVGETEQEYEPTTAEEKQDKRNGVNKLRTAIEKRYGGNKESKKVQRTLLKQQYENFLGSSSETMDQTFDRLHALDLEEQRGDIEHHFDTGLSMGKMAMPTIGARRFHQEDMQELDVIGQRVGLTGTKFKTGLGYNAASSTAASPVVESFVNSSRCCTQRINTSKSIRDIMPENLDVTAIVTPSNAKTVENKGVSNTVESNAVRINNTSAPIIEDWNSDDESEIDYTVRPSTEKIKSVKTVREIDAPKQNKQHPRGNQKNWNNLMSQRLGSDFKMTNKACYVCGSFEHLHYLCDKKVVRPVWNNSSKVNHNNFTNKMIHPHPKRSFVPQAVLTKSGKLSTASATVNTTNTKAVNTVRSVNTVALKPIMNHPRTKTNAFKRGYSQGSRPFKRHFANKNNIINSNVNTARVKHTTARDRAVVSANKGKWANAIKASACWGNQQQKEYKEKGVIDSGCSRHMTGNKCYLDEYEDYDGGFVSFGDGKGRISVPRKDNIYSVDLKSVVPTRGLTCLIAKATIDESNTWHGRLGHINFEIMNKLVKGNLVKGLPSKIFENDHSCVACQKGKQHKASYKTKLVNSISKPLHMLHMDLFGPTNVKSLMKKSYFLVVTNDFSSFAWVFFLATKDKTSGILKTFITEIENQLDHKVKFIRSNNGTEFKNSIMNQFCEINGIKREFSVARTP
ncbi:putative ribonuclease H-like domain-containing protein [Tanacetum coccineum]